MPPDVRKRSALPFRFIMNLGLRPNKLGIAQNPNGGLAGRPKAFRTSGGIAASGVFSFVLFPELRPLPRVITK